MQTRKRAKSISFGKPKKDPEVTAAEKTSVAKAMDGEEEVKEVKEHTAKAPEIIGHKEDKKEEKKPELTEAAKKVLALEELEEDPSTSSGKEEEPKVDDELSSTPEIVKGPEPVAPDEFVTDNTPSSTETPEQIEPKETEEAKPLISDNLSLPTEPEVSPIVEPEKEKASEESSELSATPPASAFTIAGNDIDASAGTEGKKKNFVLYFIIVALISFVLGLGAMAAVSYFGIIKLPLTAMPNPNDIVNQLNPQSSPTTAAPSDAPTVVPTEKPLDLKAYTISVLNGSGVKGKAAEVKTSLTTAGFKVGTSGNADRSDYTSTQIAAKKTVDKAYLDALSAELKKTYDVESVSTIPSDSSQTADVIVTLGSKAAN